MPDDVQLKVSLLPEVQAVLETVKAGFTFGTEFVRWLQTKEGQAWCEQLRTDRAEWDKAGRDIGAWFERLFNGDLFK